MQEKFKSLKDDDVVAATSSMPVAGHPLFRVKPYIEEATRRAIGGNGDQRNAWIEGVECEMLSPGAQWKKGKVRVRVVLEFCPEGEEEKDNSDLWPPPSNNA